MTNDAIFILCGVVVALVLPALGAWLLQRNARRMHPAITALLVILVLVVIEIIYIGVEVLRAVGSINESTQNPVSGAGSYAVTLMIVGVPMVMGTLVLGYPAALLAAFRVRKKPAE